MSQQKSAEREQRAKNRYPWAITISCLLAALGLALFAFLQNSDDNVSTPGETVPVAARKAGPLLDPPAYSWSIGERLSYATKWSIASAASSESEGGDAQLTFEGVWSVKVVSLAQDRVMLAAGFKTPRIQAGTERVRELEELIEQSPTYVEMNPNGRVIEVHVPSTLEHADAEFLKTISSYQVHLPEQRGNWTVGATWPSKDEDANGTMETQYKLLGESEVQKKNIRYSKLNPELKSFSVKLTESTFRAQLGQVWLEALNGTVATEISAGNEQVMQSVVRLSLKRVATVEDSPIWAVDPSSMQQALASMREHTPAAAAGKNRWEQAQERKLREKYAKVPVAQLVKRLTHAVTTAERHSETVKEIHALRDWLLADSAHASELAQQIGQGNHAAPVTARMMNALELAGTPEAQQALADIVSNDGAETHVREQALVAASGISAAMEPKLMNALKDSALQGDKELGASPLLNAGIVAETEPEMEEFLVANFSEQLEPSANTPAEELTAIVDSFTNGSISSSSVARHIEQLMGHPDARVRASSLEYLARVGGAPFETIAGALDDPSQLVQRVALEAMFGGRYDVSQAASAALRHASARDAADSVRMAVVHAVAEPNVLKPEYLGALAAVAKVSESEEVKQAVESVLAGESLVQHAKNSAPL